MANTRILDLSEPELLEFQMEDGTSEEEAQSYIEGDMWIDCDLLFTSEGRAIDFVTLTPNEREEWAVVRDADMLSEEEGETLLSFIGHHPTPISVAHLPDAHTWYEGARLWAVQNKMHLVAYRGGQGYTYGLFPMHSGIAGT